MITKPPKSLLTALQMGLCSFPSAVSDYFLNWHQEFVLLASRLVYVVAVFLLQLPYQPEYSIAYFRE
jgi:hypothetical protein